MNAVVDYCKKISLGNFENGEWKETASLNKGEFELYLKDILYYEKNNKGNSNMVLHDKAAKNGVPDSILNEAEPCIKSLPWSYENEVRLIVEVDDDENSKNSKFCRISLDDIEKEFKSKNNRTLSKANNSLYCSPKFKADKQEKNLDVKIKVGNKRRRKIKRSKLTGLINWNLTDDLKKHPPFRRESDTNAIIISL